mmetsp:Transcript_999/g.3270  ORF Transcript_999/g.3270 Transcript_999/m.3270 type:complete len:247 (-) Transcript_999:9-749(-)
MTRLPMSWPAPLRGSLQRSLARQWMWWAPGSCSPKLWRRESRGPSMQLACYEPRESRRSTGDSSQTGRASLVSISFFGSHSSRSRRWKQSGEHQHQRTPPCRSTHREERVSREAREPPERERKKERERERGSGDGGEETAPPTFLLSTPLLRPRLSGFCSCTSSSLARRLNTLARTVLLSRCPPPPLSVPMSLPPTPQSTQPARGACLFFVLGLYFARSRVLYFLPHYVHIHIVAKIPMCRVQVQI